MSQVDIDVAKIMQLKLWVLSQYIPIRLILALAIYIYIFIYRFSNLCVTSHGFLNQHL